MRDKVWGGGKGEGLCIEHKDRDYYMKGWRRGLSIEPQRNGT